MIRPSSLAILFCLFLAACGGTKLGPVSTTERAAPGKGIGIYKVGQPYQINGVWYYPTPDLSYDETGIASWYGADFQERYTANGEVFDQNAVTAAHKILPLPSIVQVTNLDNGRSIQVRVNDRGPSSANRILDMSRRSAQLLGFEQTGTAKVRVRILVPETLQAQSLAKANGSEGGTSVAATSPDVAPAAVPRQSVEAEALPPPPGAKQAAPPKTRAPAPSAAPPAPEPIRVANGEPVPPGPPLSPTVTVLPVHPTQIFIQAGAFANGANADRMKAKLAAVGPVQMTAVRVGGVNVYRVRLGPAATVDAADAMLAKAIAAGANEAKIVVD